MRIRRVKMTYIGNWLALGACIYGGKTADAALQILGLRRGRKEKRNDVDTSTLIGLREKGLTLREIAEECGASVCFVRKHLLVVGVELNRIQREK